jgi:Tol biopolymer transport system component
MQVRCLTFLLVLLLACASAHAQSLDPNHPELVWEVLETEHFKVYYHQGLTACARRASDTAESVYGPVTGFYGFEPDEKIRLIIKDTDDYANGAAYYYHNTIEIWASSLDYELRGATDWLQNVIAHEFTHIISLQTARKGPRRLPALYLHMFGYQSEGRRDDILTGYPDVFVSYAIPLTMIPPWFAEGTAQNMAPDVHFDRWDSHRDMILRMATLNDRLLTYDEMGVFGAKTGLGYEKVYDHGYALTLYIADTYGQDRLGELYRAMAVPWRIDFGSAVQSVLGISGRDLHAQWVASLNERYALQKAEVGDEPVDGELIYSEGYFNFHPRWSPDGERLAFLSNKGSDYGRMGLYIRTMADSSMEIATGGASTAIDWSPDGDRLLFARRSAPNHHGSRFWDLYTVAPDSAGGKGAYQAAKEVLGLSGKLPANETRLTRDERSVYPAYSPDGSAIAFVKNGAGSTNLAVLYPENGRVVHLTSFDDGTQVFTPRWSPDGAQIAYSLFRPDGTRDIALTAPGGADNSMLPEGAGTMPVVSSSGTDRDPAWTPDGTGLVFASDLDGIFNLYHLDLLTGEVHRITQVMGGALQPHVNPVDGRLAFAHYGADAYEIRVIDARGVWQPQDHRLFVPEDRQPPPAAARVASGEKDRPSVRPYRGEFSTTSMFPRLALDAGKLKVGIFAGSEDVLKKQSLFVGGMVAKDLDLDLFTLYEYRRWRPTLFLELYRAVRHVDEDVLNRDENYRIYNQTFALSGIEIGARHKLAAGGRLDARFIYNRAGTKQDQAFYNGLGRATLSATTLNGVNLAFTYRNEAIAPSKDSDVNPRVGRELSFRYDRFFNYFLSGFKQNSSILIEEYDNYYYNQFTLDWTEYIPAGPGRSAFGFRLYGGLIDSEVDDYFDYFLGGMPYLKGYTFYSLEGRRALMGRAAYRFPLWSRIDRQTGPIYSDQLFGSIYTGIGRAWDGDADDDLLGRNWKRDVGVQLRYDATSFYLFPTRVSLDVAYGFDSVPLQRPQDPVEKSGFKVYFTMLFGFLQSVGI